MLEGDEGSRWPCSATNVFGPYQFHQARILEFPAYRHVSRSPLPTPFPYSENVGFLFSNQRDPAQADLVTYITAHEDRPPVVGASARCPADKQGSSMLLETLAQYSALLVMEKLQGREQVHRFTQDTSLTNTCAPVAAKPWRSGPWPASRASPTSTITRAALVMYWLREVLGRGHGGPHAGQAFGSGMR